MLIAAISSQINAQQNSNLLNVEQPQSFNDQSALNVKSNLQSRQYQDFIHTLYRYDKDNLKRVDNLFANPDQVGPNHSNNYDQAAVSQINKQPTYADYVKTQQPTGFYNFDGGFSAYSGNRFKRSAQGAIFRPRFVYRIFQERARKREEERIQRRLLKYIKTAKDSKLNDVKYEINQ